VSAIFAAVIVGATLVGMLIRPRGVTEAWAAAAGGTAMLLCRIVTPRQALHDVRDSADILFFLLGMMAITAATERAGVYEHLAEWSARLARGSGTLLFANVFILGALVTTLLSLDVMVIVVTPIVYQIAVHRRLDPLPFMFACAFVANTGSMLLPISNLTNLLVYQNTGVTFIEFARTMWLAEIVAVATNFLIFLIIFRNSIPRRLPRAIAAELPATDWWYYTAGGLLAATLVGLLACGLTGNPLSYAAIAGALIVLAVGLLGSKVVPAEIGRKISWPLIIFVIGMLIVVRSAEQTFLAGARAPLPDNASGALAAAAAICALGSDVVNNVPMTLLALQFLRNLGPSIHNAAIWGTLAGVNIGPTLTTYGSLATMLRLTAIRKRGLEVSTKLYLRVGLIAMPVILTATVFALLVTQS
jgi:arsenical pump membrane protein